MKDKCFSKVNRGQRKKSDFYQTPYSMTRALLEVEYFDKRMPVLEPACGEGAIVKVLEDKKFQEIFYYDIKEKDGFDFLEEENTYYNLITNPPFSLANDFIMKAREIIEFKSAFLLPLNYLQGQWRYENIYNKTDDYFSLESIYVFTRMPMLTDTIRTDGKYKTGMQAYAWFVFKRLSYKVFYPPRICWIDSKNQVMKNRVD